MVLVKALRRNNVARTKRMGDPDGVMATLQIARRLLSERTDKGVYPALDEGLDLAAPKDRSRAWWAAHRAVIDALPEGFTTIGDFTMLSGTSTDDVLAVFDRAILAHGQKVALQAKGKQPKVKRGDL